jgi:hypothetical protein
MTTGNPFRKSASKVAKRPASRVARRVAGRSQSNSERSSVAGRGSKAPSRMRVVDKKRLASRHEESLYDDGGSFNPQRYDRSSRVAGNNRRMFDRKGEINAYDKKDALTQTYHLLNNITKKNASSLTMTRQSQFDTDKQRRTLTAALKDPSGQGFHRVGQELLLPIKAILDYEGFSRKIYRVRKLGQAELFRIPKDVRSVAYTIGQDGMTPEARIKTAWITPPEFKVTSFPAIDIMDIYQSNFDIIARAQDTARQEIELKEDKAGINMLDSASTAINTATTFTSLGIGAFEDVRYQVERHRLLVENFLISRAEISDIVKTMSGAVDPVTERELILAGYIGTVLNSQILTAAGTGVEEVIPAGTFYATTGSDYLGELGERIELFSEQYNRYGTGETVKGWAFVEMIGFALPNAKAVAKGSK